MSTEVTARAAGAQEALQEMGYEQTLKRGFTMRSAFALAFAFISPIVALYGIFALALGAAGPAMWWAFLLVLGGQLIVALVFAETASVLPLAGGVYQWSRQFLGNSYGWFAGWAYVWTLVIAMTAVAYGGAGFLAALLDIDAPANGTLVLLSLVFMVIGTVGNMIGRGVLKTMVTASIACEFVGSVLIGTILLLFYRENSLGTIFESFGTNADGGAYVLGPLLAAAAFIGFTFVGFESAGAIAEEVEEPRRDVPKAILLSLLVVAAVVIYTALAIILAIPNLEAVVAGEVGDPITDTLAAQLGAGVSKPLFAVICIGFLASYIALQTTASRVIFSFSRDRAFPAHRVLGRLAGAERLPVNAVLLAGIVSALLLVLTGSDFYATLISFTAGGFFVAFIFPVAATLVARLRGRWQAGAFTLGGLGLALNAVALVWLVFMFFNIAWPRATDLPWYQNWGVFIMVVVVGALGVLAYLSVRRTITQPRALESLSKPPGSL